MERTSPSPLAQAIAAIFDLLIAALAEHAAEHPMLAPGIRATIRQIEQTAKKLDRMIAEWEATKATQAQNPPRRKQAIHMETERRRERMASLRLSVSMWNRLPFAPRAPSGPAWRRHAASPRAPPTPDSCLMPEELPRKTLRPGARRAYPSLTPPVRTASPPTRPAGKRPHPPACRRSAAPPRRAPPRT